MVHYILNYFNFRGRGELPRLIFAAADHKFEDKRFEFTHWHEFKSKAPFGSAPWLEIHDGNHVTSLAQSPAISRYLARKFHLAGKNELEAAELEMFGDQLFDLQTEIININLELESHRKKSLQEKLFTQTLPHDLKILDERIGKTGSGHFAASGLSWVDLHLMNIMDLLDDKKDEILASYPHVKALDEKVRELPNIAAWIAKRPKTSF